MTDQGAEFEIVGTGHLGEVVFPNEEVFVILPRRLVPKSRISICAPVCWQAHAGRLWENGREFRGNVSLECHSCCIRRNYDVVSGARELELVNRSRTQGRRQLDGKTMAGLVPIRGQGWERRIAPEVPRRIPVCPGLICILDQQIHLLADVDVSSNTVLTG